MNLRKNIKILLVFGFLIGCGTKTESVEPFSVFNCKVVNDVSIVEAKGIVESYLSSKGLVVTEGDQSSLQRISGRKGAVFHLWVSGGGTDVLTVHNLSDPKKFLFSYYVESYESMHAGVRLGVFSECEKIK